MGVGENKDLIDIEAMAKKLDRSVVTLRSWIREKALPKELKPQRVGGRKKIFWSKDQIEGLRAFAEQREARRGWQHV